MTSKTEPICNQKEELSPLMQKYNRAWYDREESFDLLKGALQTSDETEEGKKNFDLAIGRASLIMFHVKETIKMDKVVQKITQQICDEEDEQEAN